MATVMDKFELNLMLFLNLIENNIYKLLRNQEGVERTLRERELIKEYWS